MSHNKAPIMIMAGGTGGHVFPALAIADELTKQGENIVWMGTKKGLETRVVPQAGYPIEWLSVSGLRGKGVLTLLAAPFKLLQALLQATQILVKHKPKAVLGMGGFVAGPGGIMSWLMRVPLFIHEQNAVVGLTNQWLSRFSKKIFYGFPQPQKQAKQGLYVGNPVRQSLINLTRKPANDEHRLLVLGGSLGAAQLNKLVPEALQQIDQSALHVLHQCGERHLAVTEKAYQPVRAQYQVKAFIDDMQQAYEWADFIVCRSGALTVAEITNVGLASILVPYPYAVDDHQTANAELLVKAKAAVVIADNELTSTHLAEQLFQCFMNVDKRNEMAAQSKLMAKPEATQTVVNEILQVVNS